MIHVDAARLRDDLHYRVEYLKHFIDWSEVDRLALRAAVPHLSCTIPGIVDAIYRKLLSSDITSRQFSQLDRAEVEALPSETRESAALILHSKKIISSWILTLFQCEDDDAFWHYLDSVGRAHVSQPGHTSSPGIDHTEKRGRRQPLHVDYIHNGMLLGHISDIVFEFILAVPGFDFVMRRQCARSFNKLMWLQNDLFARHYDWREGESHQAVVDIAQAARTQQVHDHGQRVDSEPQKDVETAFKTMTW